MLREILAYHEVPGDWLRNDSPLSGSRGEELSSWLMEPIAVRELISEIDKLSSLKGVITRIITHLELTNFLANLTPASMLWNITDGCLPFHGSYVPAAAALLGLPFFGNVPFVQMLGQDKFKFYSFCAAIGISTPRSILVDFNGVRIGEMIKASEFFVKPNTLGNSIGINQHSRFQRFSMALEAAVQLARQFNCAMLVQEFISGTQFRATFIDHSQELSPESKVRVFRVKRSGISAKLGYIPHVPHGQPLQERYFPADGRRAVKRVLSTTCRLVEHIPLKDYGSFDIIVDKCDVPWVIDFNPCPFLDNESTERFIPGRSLADLMWAAISRSYDDQTKALRVALSTRGTLKSQK
jgi:hypothetical protein